MDKCLDYNSYALQCENDFIDTKSEFFKLSIRYKDILNSLEIYLKLGRGDFFNLFFNLPDDELKLLRNLRKAREYLVQLMVDDYFQTTRRDIKEIIEFINYQAYHFDSVIHSYVEVKNKKGEIK